MDFLNATFAVFIKDLRIELRTREILLTTGLFALLITLLSSFAFGLDVMPGVNASAGVLWISISFSGILAIGRTYTREADFGVWRSLMMTPAPRAAVYLGKTLGVTVFLIAVELVLIPVIELFFHAPLIACLPSLLPVLFLATVGYAAVGTLFGAMAV